MITNLEASTYVKRAESHALLNVIAGVLSQFVITDQQMKQTAGCETCVSGCEFM